MKPAPRLIHYRRKRQRISEAMRLVAWLSFECIALLSIAAFAFLLAWQVLRALNQYN